MLLSVIRLFGPSSLHYVAPIHQLSTATKSLLFHLHRQFNLHTQTAKMGKSSRASTIKQNNRRLKANVFGPVEAARAERLHAKMAELIAQPKPVKEVEMNDEEPVDEAKEVEAEKEEAAMEVDEKPAAPFKEKERKRRGKKSNIVFRKKGPKTNSKKK